MTPALHAAIENLHAVFADIPKPDFIDGCPCCLDEKDISILLSKPLRALSPEELTQYASSVFLTVGDKEDFLYFIPRILEILATVFGWWPDAEVVGCSLGKAGIDSWPAGHREAIFRYFTAAIDDSIQGMDGWNRVDPWICALGKFTSDLSHYLERIARSPQALIEYYEYNSECLIKGKLANPFWEDTQETQKQVIDWFNSPEIRGRIHKAYGMA